MKEDRPILSAAKM